METVDPGPYHLAEQRIAQLTLVLGALASAGACLLFSIRVGAGVLIGAFLAWLNFRWLKNGLDSVVRVSTAQAGSAKARLPVGSLVGLFGRYCLIAASVCAIFIFFKIPVLSMLVGLCALGAATIVASLYEIFRFWD
jgi:small-conductance mechanosensitive channel